VLPFAPLCQQSGSQPQGQLRGLHRQLQLQDTAERFISINSTYGQFSGPGSPMMSECPPDSSHSPADLIGIQDVMVTVK
jgi:hypothetical protein